jgi:hypothetical protein
MPGFTFNSDIGGFNWHTNSLVPVYAKGAGSYLFNTVATGTDSVRGKYLDNTSYIKVFKGAFVPAAFTVGAMTLSDDSVTPGKAVIVTVPVTNIGQASGTYEAILKVDGVAAKTASVIIPAATTTKVIFTFSDPTGGVYSLSVGAATGTVAVEATPETITATVTAPAPPASTVTTTKTTTTEVEKTNSTVAIVIGIVGAVIIIVLVVLLVMKKK